MQYSKVLLLSALLLLSGLVYSQESDSISEAETAIQFQMSALQRSNQLSLIYCDQLIENLQQTSIDVESALQLALKLQPLCEMSLQDNQRLYQSYQRSLDVISQQSIEVTRWKVGTVCVSIALVGVVTVVLATAIR